MPESTGRERDAGVGEAPSYAAAGVDIGAADRFKSRLHDLVARTHDARVLGGIGGFGGAFALEGVDETDPVLVASADGVGTKVVVAQRAGLHDTVGHDLVNHCVNDVLAAGARPLFFLDSIATGRLDGDVAADLVEGFARGCSENRIPLLGGETAEMPDVYAPGVYDLAGFIVGVAPRARVDAGSRVRPGDVVLGLASSGLHTNGYTLARRIVFETAGCELDDSVPWDAGRTWADELLVVHRSYRALVAPLLDDPGLHGAAHVTGGGFAGNLPRALPPGAGVVIDRGAWEIPPVFAWLAERGGVSREEMARVFNLGIGFCLYVAAGDVERIVETLAAGGRVPATIGEVVGGSGVEWR